MQAYLVQHGEAKRKEEDADRPLTEKGQQDVGRLAGFLGGAGVRVGEIWHSGKTRASQTAGILAGAVGTAGTERQYDGLGPEDDPGPMANELDEMEQDVMLVGHMPFMGALAALLLVDDEEEELVAFRPGAVLCLERMEVGAWQVRWMVAPELLG